MLDARDTPGGSTIPRGGLAFLAFAGAALALLAVRVLGGLGAVTALSDGYPWGLWMALDVGTVTGVGAGALALALVVHLASNGPAHPLARSALRAGAVAYALAGVAALAGMGRWWNAWALLVPPWWSSRSALLGATLCALACCAVLWALVAAPGLERLARGPRGPASAVASAMRPALPALLALALVLPLLHQASLGAVLVVARTRLHPLWHTSWLPALFVLSSLSMGIAAVLALEGLADLRRRPHRAGDARLGSPAALGMAALSLAFLALRLGDLAWTGGLRHLDRWRGVLFLLETLLLLYPALRVIERRYREDPGLRLWSAQLTLAAGVLYRLDAYLAAGDPGAGWIYFPSLGELLFSAALLATGAAGWLAAERREAASGGRPARTSEPAARPRRSA